MLRLQISGSSIIESMLEEDEKRQMSELEGVHDRENEDYSSWNLF